MLLHFDADTSKWLEGYDDDPAGDSTDWDIITGGSDFSNDRIDSIVGLRHLFGDTDTNDDFLQFTIADGLGVEIL